MDQETLIFHVSVLGLRAAYQFITHRRRLCRCLCADKPDREIEMPSVKTTKIIVKYARVFETVSLIYSIVGLLNLLLEIRIIFFLETGITDWNRQYHHLMMGFFAMAFLMGYIAKIGFSVIREASQKGNIKIES
jgi:hypothetical protein